MSPTTMRLGRSDVVVSRLGVGAMTWGNPAMIAYGGSDGVAEEKKALEACVAGGVTLIDTAEMYGRGKSETRVGELVGARTDVQLATKFMPLPWRSSASLPGALDRSLARLARSSVALYQIHAHAFWISNAKLMRRLADAVKSGKVAAVGVSNYSAAQVRAAHAALAEHGVPLASNQIEWSLLHRAPERDGTLAACEALGVTVIAYMPLASGALSGKYTMAARPGGVRSWMPYFRGAGLARTEAVVTTLREIGARHEKTPSQVALRWLIERGALPIPGAKNERQAVSNAGALGFALGPDEMAALDRAAPL